MYRYHCEERRCLSETQAALSAAVSELAVVAECEQGVGEIGNEKPESESEDGGGLILEHYERVVVDEDVNSVSEHPGPPRLVAAVLG